MSRLRTAILARQSLLVFGQADSGKSALLNEVLSGLPDAVRRNCLVCNSSETPRRMWQGLIGSLSAANDPHVLSRVKRESGSQATLGRWVEKQSSLRLRGVLRSAMRASNYCVFIDTPRHLPAGSYRLLQEWVWSGRTPVFLLARGATEPELGKAARLFWHKGMKLELGPLQVEDAKSLLEDCIARFHLQRIADAEFRDFVLTRCEGLPGRIVYLCELASQSAYQSAGHVKLHTLAVDFLMRSGPKPATVLEADRHD